MLTLDDYLLDPANFADSDDGDERHRVMLMDRLKQYRAGTLLSLKRLEDPAKIMTAQEAILWSIVHEAPP